MTGKNKSPGMTVLFFLLSSSDKRSAFRGSLDIRVIRSAWRYGWMSGTSPNMTERKISTAMTILFSYAWLLISLLFCVTKINMVPSLVDRKICSFINGWLFPQISVSWYSIGVDGLMPRRFYTAASFVCGFLIISRTNMAIKSRFSTKKKPLSPRTGRSLSSRGFPSRICLMMQKHLTH